MKRRESPTGYDAATDDPRAFVGPVVINPGSGPVEVGPEAGRFADVSIRQFVQDLRDGVHFRAGDDGAAIVNDEIFISHGTPKEDGRIVYMLRVGENECSVEMPALALESVRYLRRPEQSIWHYPRLYVNGSSWVWWYALASAARKLNSLTDELGT